MDEAKNEGDAFAIPNLWKTSSLAQFESNTTHLATEPWYTLSNDIDWGQSLQEQGKKGLEDIGSIELVLPDLSSFKYGPLEFPETLESFSASSTEGSNDEEYTVEDDLWIAPNLLAFQQHPEFNSWENFHDREFREPRTVYLSEGGLEVFNAVLKLHLNRTKVDQQITQIILDPGSFLKGLVQLGLGRESVFFKYDLSKGEFQNIIEGGCMSGYTDESFSSLVSIFKNYGNKTKRIQKFVDSVYASNNSFPTLVSLANASSIVLSALQSQTGKLYPSISSALQLQSVFRRHGLILACLDEVIERVGTAQSDKNLLSKLYKLLQDLENTDSGIRQLGFKILGHVSKPWLESVSYWLGINKDIPLESRGIANNHELIEEKKGRREGANNTQDPECQIQPTSLPDFILDADATALFETSQSLQLLREHKAQHPLARSKAVLTASSRILEWQFSWRDAERIANQAKEYERNISEAIGKFHTSESSDELLITNIAISQPWGVGTSEFSKEDTEAQIAASNLEIEMPIFEILPSMDPLEQAVANCTILSDTAAEAEDTQFEPPLSLIPSLSFNPMISAQARLVNHACMRLLFREHNVRLHLSIQNRFNLFGDAVFATRLSHALFDPDLQSAERRKGHSRSGVSGLRLGSRDTWPPASSELRLALMGILTDSFSYNSQPETSSASFDTELPGGLSFAVREMSEDEFQRCMDPDSIEALDFLRLQYRPPALLDVIITPSCLTKYDSLFKILLRGMRMLYVVNQFSRDASNQSSNQHRIKTIVRKFKLEAQHFVSTICSYYFGGIKACWRVFSQRLDEIERQLDQHDSQQQGGLHELRDFHEKVLDRMMFAVFLRKRQVQVVRLVEEIFSTILVFARLSRRKLSSTNDGNQDDTKIEDTYRRFTKKVRVFVSVCKGFSERRVQGGSNSYENMLDHDGFRRGGMNEDGENTVGHLLLKLDMNGYYSKSIKH